MKRYANYNFKQALTVNLTVFCCRRINRVPVLQCNKSGRQSDHPRCSYFITKVYTGILCRQKHGTAAMGMLNTRTLMYDTCDVGDLIGSD